MPFFVSDYLGDTQHLNTQQHGAYCLLLFACWNRGGSLPDDNEVLRLVTRLSPREWKALRPVLAEFFCVAEGKWVQKRLLKEMHKAIATTHRRREAGATGAERRWRPDGKANGPAKANELANGSQIDANSELRTHTSIKTLSNGAAREGGSGPGDRDRWVARISSYAPGGFWMVNNWGPPPDKHGCLGPPDLVAAWRAQRSSESAKA